jgi:hypothetical protein
LSYPKAIVVDSSFVYWTQPALVQSPVQSPEGKVMKVALTGGTPSPVAAAQDNPADIAIDGTSLYWTNTGHWTNQQAGSYVAGSVAKAPLSGGPPVTIAGGLNVPVEIGVDANSVYWVENGLPLNDPNPTANGLWRANRDGSSPTKLSGYPGIAGGHVAVNATTAFYTTVSFSVWSQPLAGGASGPLWYATTNNSIPWDIAIDANSVYWTNFNTGLVMTIPLSGGTAQTLFDPGPGVGSAAGIAVDGTSVYWLNCPQTAVCSLMKAPLAGGAAVTLASGLNGGMFVAVDATSVYWTTSDSVMRIAK